MSAIIPVQAIYILITAIWPIVHIESFVAITGPKEDVWLVKTVGALLIPVGVTLLIYHKRKSDFWMAFALASLTALAFIFIDFYYAMTDVIWDVYMLDGVVEIVFFINWMVLALKKGTGKLS